MSSPLRFLFLMDPYEALNLETETSLLLMKELIEQGQEVFWVEEEDFTLRQNQLEATTRAVISTAPLTLDIPTHSPLADFSAILIRKDPPFDLGYYHLTLLLEHLPKNLVQINPAKSLRNFNEKLFGLKWPHFVPPTITTANPKSMLAFLQEQGEIVLKPLEDCSGRGISRLKVEDSGAIGQIYALMRPTPESPIRYVTAQRFLPQVAEGDKRVYLLWGKPVGMVNRIPAEDGFLGNIHQGARCVKTSLTLREEEILAELAPVLRQEGLALVGLDLIGEQITEINLTSPSALRQINEVMQTQLEVEMVQSLIRFVQAEAKAAGTAA